MATTRYTLFLRVHSANKLQLATPQALTCTLYLGDTPVTNSTVTSDSHRIFSTKPSTANSVSSALWNEKFEISVDNQAHQVLSVRVSPSVGACAIQLRQLRPNTTVDQSFPLFRGSKSSVGAIRMQLMLKENVNSNGSDKIPIARPVVVIDDVPVVKKVVEESYGGLETRVHQNSMAALQEERRRLEQEEEERKQRERERQRQLALEKQRIEEKMAQLKREEEERQRLRQEAEERQRLQAMQREQDNQVGEGIKEKKKSSRRSSLSLKDMIDAVVQDSLPSDSDDSSSEELDSDDERELIRQIAKLKLQMKKKKKAAKAKLQKQKDDKAQVDNAPKVVYIYETEYHYEEASDHEDDHKKLDKSKHAQSFNDDLYGRHSLAKKDKHSKSQGDVVGQYQRQVQAMTPNQIQQKKANNNNNDLSLGQMVGAAVGVVNLFNNLENGGSLGDIAQDAMGIAKNLTPGDQKKNKKNKNNGEKLLVDLAANAFNQIAFQSDY